MSKKILVIGNGGREHTIVEALSRSPQNPEIYNLGNAVNPGIKKLCKEVIVGNYMDLDFVKSVAEKISPDFAVVGPDDPIGIGAVDALLELDIKSFAPTKACAQLESSKAFTRKLLEKYKISGSPEFLVLTSSQANPHPSSLSEGEGMKDDLAKLAQDFYDKFEGQIVVKADGLLGGKGVLVAGEHFSKFSEAFEFAQKSIEKFGRVVLEEKLLGEEFSLISLVDGETVLDTPVIQDHKRAFEGDTGPNTGGMGCISDENHSLPFISEQNKKEAHDMTVQVMKAVEQETGEKFVGVMYGGFMVTKNGVKLIEYNARFGDPEALNILPILETDFVDVCEKAIAGKLSEIDELKFKNVATVVKYLCPNGYPENPVKNEKIKFLGTEENLENIYFASVAEEDGELILKGSRAVGILGTGGNIAEALEDCEEKIKYFEGPLFYRKDIGTPEIIQKRIDHMKEILGE